MLTQRRRHTRSWLILAGALFCGSCSAVTAELDEDLPDAAVDAAAGFDGASSIDGGAPPVGADASVAPPPDAGAVSSSPRLTLWSSAGGGTIAAPSRMQLQLWIGSPTVSATATRPGGASVTFGTFSDLTD